MQYYFFLIAFSIVVVLGNSLRLFGHPFADGHSINVGEIFICIIGCFGIFVVRIKREVLLASAIFCFMIFASYLFGLIKSGWLLEPFVYASRLILLILFSSLCAKSFIVLSRNNRLFIFNFAIAIYVSLAIFSISILLLYPNSTILWELLAEQGIEFSGDPHMFRLVSPYFDPNFYGCVVVMPIMFLVVKQAYSPSVSQIFSLMILIISLLFTLSRSAYSLLAVNFFALCVYHKPIARMFFGSLNLMNLLIYSGAVAFILLFSSSEQLSQVYVKFFKIASDQSALSRLESFNLGIEMLRNELFFGYGYNYTIGVARDLYGGGLDSSILVGLNSFGTLLSAFITAYFFYLAIGISKRINGISVELYSYWKVYIIYVITTALLASWFNNILFYFYWLLPVLTFFFYFLLASFQKSERVPCVP